MPTTPHFEQHFTGSRAVRNIVIGMSDGLTVPFALAAGLSGAVDSTRIVITAGLAEIATGSIAMGLGGYLAAKSDLEHYEIELAREQREVLEKPEAEGGEVEQMFREYGLVPERIASMVQAFRRRPGSWIEFMMRYELGLERPDPKAALTGALTIGGRTSRAGSFP